MPSEIPPDTEQFRARSGGSKSKRDLGLKLCTKITRRSFGLTIRKQLIWFCTDQSSSNMGSLIWVYTVSHKSSISAIVNSKRLGCDKGNSA